MADDPLDQFSDAPRMDAATRDFLRMIDDALDDDDCQYAVDTLRSIRANVVGAMSFTENQRDAVANIIEGGRRGRGGRRDGYAGRRYEGFHGRRR